VSLVLGLDTAAGVSVGLARDGVVLARRWLEDSRRHVESLVPLVVEALDSVGLTVADLTAVAVGVGPGPFTGLRVGVVAAQTLADARGLHLRRVCSLDVVALSRVVGRDPTMGRNPWAAPGHAVGWDRAGAGDDQVADSHGLTAVEWDRAGAGDFLATLDARRHEVYWARYDTAGRRLDGPHVGPVQSLPDLPRVGFGAPGRDRSAERAAESAQAAGPTVDAGLLAARADDLPEAGPEPLYLRRPDAVASTTQKSVLAAGGRS